MIQKKYIEKYLPVNYMAVVLNITLKVMVIDCCFQKYSS